MRCPESASEKAVAESLSHSGHLEKLRQDELPKPILKSENDQFFVEDVTQWVAKSFTTVCYS